MEISIQSLLEGATRATGTVAIIDVFRAFTTAAVALANGASRIVMVSTVEEALGKTPGFHRLDRRIPGHPDWLAEEPVSSEPVSGREFPANRENNREFCKIGADRRLRRRKTRRYNNGLEANSLRDLNREFSEA